MSRPRPVLFLLLLGASCGPRGQTDSGPAGAPAAEERFGNDLAVVQRFAALASCAYQQGRLDHACPQLASLRQLLDRRRQEAEARPKLTATLLNLLESRRELSRLVAAGSLFPEHREPRVRKAVRAALDRERAPSVKATLLRQLCWEARPELEPLARSLLGASTAEAVRLEAATCLGRLPRPASETGQLLRSALASDGSPRVRATICAGLGELRLEAAVADLAAALSVPELTGPCASALAAIGSAPAFQALLAASSQGLSRGRLATQQLSALASFSGRDFFDRPEVLSLLARAARQRRLGWVTRQRAVSELGRLGAASELRSLRAAYAGELSPEDAQIRGELDRLLAEK